MEPLQFKSDPEEIEKAIRSIAGPSDDVELRVMEAHDGRKFCGTVSGYFDGDSRHLLVEAAERFSGHSPGVYITLNPVDPDVVSRAKNRVREFAKNTTKDNEIVRRKWLLIDFDSVKPSGVSATDAEHEAALERARECRAFLTSQSWPDPIFADSGNGAHLLYRIDLDPEDDSVKRILKFLSQKFTDDKVIVDAGVHNPARICKLYGTAAAKGDATEDRPHRIAYMIDVPDKLEIVPREKLVELAAMGTECALPVKRSNLPLIKIVLAAWLEKFAVPARGPKPWKGGELYEFERCPFRPDEKDGGAWVAQLPSEEIVAGCNHSKCQGKGWDDVRDEFEPGWRSTGPNGKESQAKQILNLAKACEVFRSLDGEACVTFDRKGHSETHAISSAAFRHYLTYIYQTPYLRPPSKEAVAAAVASLEATAFYESNELPTFVRVAGNHDTIYVDLCDDDWRCVKIDAGDIELIARPPVKFRRSNASKPIILPADLSGGDVNDLRKFVKLSDDEWALLVTWLVAAFWPVGPYPLLLLCGEQGTGKSTVARMIKNVTDPNASSLRSLPDTVRDLMIAAKHSRVLVFDNLSKVGSTMSDALCRMSTGGAMATRQLFTDAEEIVIDAQRPVVLTSIVEVATRPDLIDRSIMISLPVIKPEERKVEAEIWAEFFKVAPGIVAGILRAVQVAIRDLPSVKLSKASRMADFERLGTVVEASLSLPSGSVSRAYQGNQQMAVGAALESWVAYRALRAVVLKLGEFSGTAGGLVELLYKEANHEERQNDDWPDTPQKLGRDLINMGPALRKSDWTIEHSQTAGTDSRRIVVIRAPKPNASDIEEAA